jgi:hypothetical protein
MTMETVAVSDWIETTNIFEGKALCEGGLAGTGLSTATRRTR